LMPKTISGLTKINVLKIVHMKTYEMKASRFCNHSHFIKLSRVSTGAQRGQTNIILVNMHFHCKLECNNAVHTNISCCKVDTV
jgi:hypothetical protein